MSDDATTPAAAATADAPAHDAHGGHDDHHHHDPGFIRKYIFSTDHKVIGIQFMITGLIFFAMGGLFAMAIRYQLAWPWQKMPLIGSILFPETGGAITPELYTMLFTMHGTIMIFFVIIMIPFVIIMVAMIVFMVMIFLMIMIVVFFFMVIVVIIDVNLAVKVFCFSPNQSRPNGNFDRKRAAIAQAPLENATKKTIEGVMPWLIFEIVVETAMALDGENGHEVEITSFKGFTRSTMGAMGFGR